jgi:hypothetical protein
MIKMIKPMHIMRRAGLEKNSSHSLPLDVLTLVGLLTFRWGVGVSAPLSA